MHLFSRRLRRVLLLVAFGVLVPAVSPQAAMASYPWGAVQVQGCSWAPALPGICRSLDVHSNGTDTGTVNGDSGYGLQWQCVELAQRWANLAYGETYHGDTHWGIDAAYQMWGVWSPGNSDQKNYSVPFIQEPNGGQSAPQFGDLVIFAPTSGNPYGHVSVVSGLEQGYVDIVEQNWSNDSGAARLSIVGTTLADRGSYHAYGWLRAANAHNVRSLSHTAAHSWAGQLGTGDLQAALIGIDNAAWYVTGSGTTYTGPGTLGGQLVSAPTVVPDSSGNLAFFATDSTHHVARYVPAPPATVSAAPPSPSPSPAPSPSPSPPPGPTWKPLSGLTTPGKPAVVRAADGHLEVFARGMDNAYWRNYELKPGGTWAGWTSLGGILPTDPSAIIGADGAISLFGVGIDNAAWTWHQTSGSAGTWSSLGGVALGAPQVTQTAGGALEVFLVGQDNGIWHKWQVGPPSSNAWSDWAGLGGKVLGDPTVVRNASGMPEVFVIGVDGALYFANRPPSGWTAWSNQGGYFQSDISVQRDGHGLLEAFGVGPGNHMYHAVESFPGGGFGSWGSLGGIWQPN